MQTREVFFFKKGAIRQAFTGLHMAVTFKLFAARSRTRRAN